MQTKNACLRVLGALGIGVILASAALAQGTLPVLPATVAATPLSEKTAGDIRFDSKTPFDFDILLNHYDAAPATSAMARLVLPANADAAHRVPAVVLLPGSGGISPGREHEYAEMLAAHGYASLVIDYYAARGVTPATPYAQKVSSVTEFDIVTDAYAALRALNRHPAIDPQRIVVTGFSYGGMATRLTMDARMKEKLAPAVPAFAAHVDFYGPCFQDFKTERTTGAPLLSLRGGEDASNDLVGCAREEVALRKAGSAVSSVIYARAGHAWEVNTPRAPNKSPYVVGCTMIYDKDGFATVNGQAVIAPNAPPDRTQRSALRAGSGQAFKGCVFVGYIVGRDEAVKTESDKQFLAFLQKTVGK